ncbi:MAG: hypothetical protein LBN05_09005 [Oscillospiraceae bacterium]|jgi:hypothetical protein|nr:hypothetical protein [Oscillospiraceae bacterium]
MAIPYSGAQGKVSTCPTETGTATNIAHISNWSVEDNTEVQDAAYFLEDYKEAAPGVSEWSGKFDGTPDNAASAGQKALKTAKDAGMMQWFSFHLNDDDFLEGPGYITGISTGSDRNGIPTVSYSVKGAGPLKLVTGG